MQIFRIFRKDALHLWPEILVSILLLVVFAWLETLASQPNIENAGLLGFGAGILRFLIFLSWMILTSRLVHDEELVGDRQFWITRPYSWYYLLLSKVFALVVFICVPFLLMDMWMLHHAGMYPMLALPALLSNLAYIVGFALLMLLAIAAATATFIRYASSVLVGVLYVLAVVGFVVYKWPDNFAAPYMQYPLNTVIVGLLLAALFFSYAKRKTMIARLLLIGMPIAVILVLALAPLNTLIQHRYPEDASLGSLQFLGGPEFQQSAEGRLVEHSGNVVLELPVQGQFSGLPERAYANSKVIRTVIDGSAGYHFDTGWQITQGTFRQGGIPAAVLVRLPSAVFRQMQGQPVTLHVTLGLQTYEPGTPYTVTATEKPFPLTGHAACTVSAEDGQLTCRYPVENKYLTRVEARVTNGTCIAPGPRTATATGFLAPGNAVFDPVEEVKTPLAVGTENVSLCPGTSVTFIDEMPTKYVRLHVDMPGIKLENYAAHMPVASK